MAAAVGDREPALGVVVEPRRVLPAGSVAAGAEVLAGRGVDVDLLAGVDVAEGDVAVDRVHRHVVRRLVPAVVGHGVADNGATLVELGDPEVPVIGDQHVAGTRPAGRDRVGTPAVVPGVTGAADDPDGLQRRRRVRRGGDRQWEHREEARQGSGWGGCSPTELVWA